MFVLEIVWFLLAFSFAALGLARRLLWCAVQVAVWKKSSGQMPVLNAFMWFWWLFWSPVCMKALKLPVLKALMCSQFPSLWQSCGVGLATFSSLSFLIMTVFVQVIFASVHPSLPCRCNYAFLMPLNCKDLGKTLSTSLMAKCNTSFSSFGVVTLVCSKH